MTVDKLDLGNIIEFSGCRTKFEKRVQSVQRGTGPFFPIWNKKYIHYLVKMYQVNEKIKSIIFKSAIK